MGHYTIPGQPSITVRIKDQYGKAVFYPSCPASHIFASIAGTNTLTQPTLQRIKSLGYQINVEQQKVTI